LKKNELRKYSPKKGKCGESWAAKHKEIQLKGKKSAKNACKPEKQSMERKQTITTLGGLGREGLKNVCGRRISNPPKGGELLVQPSRMTGKWRLAAAEGRMGEGKNGEANKRKIRTCGKTVSKKRKTAFEVKRWFRGGEAGE